jgi:Trk-type K+ transport system membrane component
VSERAAPYTDYRQAPTTSTGQMYAVSPILGCATATTGRIREISEERQLSITARGQRQMSTCGLRE